MTSYQQLPRQLRRKYLALIKWRRQQILEQRHSFQEKYPETAIGAFLASGKNFFDKMIVATRYREVIRHKPFMTFSNGDAKLFFQRNPLKRYIVGADVATGRQVTSDKTDFCAATVIDEATGEQVACYHAMVTPEQFAIDLNDLGGYYNQATIAIERTGDGGTTILVLKNDFSYGNIYSHVEWDVKNKQKVLVEGFPTTTKTRPIALNKLNWHVLMHPEHFWDPLFLMECLTFVKDEKGKPTAIAGAHDDTVSSNWIAHGARQVMLGYWDPVSSASQPYLDSIRITAEAIGAVA